MIFWGHCSYYLGTKFKIQGILLDPPLISKLQQMNHYNSKDLTLHMFLQIGKRTSLMIEEGIDLSPIYTIN